MLLAWSPNFRDDLYRKNNQFTYDQFLEKLDEKTFIKVSLSYFLPYINMFVEKFINQNSNINKPSQAQVIF